MTPKGTFPSAAVVVDGSGGEHRMREPLIGPAPNATADLFDQVWVLSLPSAEERRRHITRHLPEMGIENFSYFDATSADDPLVERTMRSGEVMRFPPCFRCGQLECGDPDCNNFLIPAQVAVFLSYRRLWRAIADGPAERVLVLEDDVLFHPHAARVLAWVAAETAAGRLPFTAEYRCLLRLGWARCEEHSPGDAPCRADNTLKMANPCHALTRKFAVALLERYRRIEHTADVFLHHLAPRPDEAYTVYPPIASELSWTDGVFASSIHPKPVRADFLRAKGDAAGADAYAREVSAHVKKKYYRPLLLTGHPRCGTGYAANLCRQLGLDVGHEKLGTDGISSWMFAVDADRNPYALDEVASSRRSFVWRYLVMPVRDIGAAAGSVMRDSLHAPPSYDFRREHVLRHLDIDLNDLADPLERAVWSVTSWARIVLGQQPDLCWRIEDQQELLRAFLLDQGLCPGAQRVTVLDTSPVNSDQLYRGVRYLKPHVSANDWAALSRTTREEVSWYCRLFGYGLPWERHRESVDHAR